MSFKYPLYSYYEYTAISEAAFLVLIKADVYQTYYSIGLCSAGNAKEL